MTDFTELQQALDAISPGSCTYQEWLAVGMGLKEAGAPVSAWEQWSARDGGRYHKGECARKWETFRGSPAPVTENSIYKMARDRGWAGPADKELDWDDEITVSPSAAASGRIVDPHWLDVPELAIPAPDAPWNPAEQLIAYLRALFEPADHVAYVTESFMDKDRRRPTKGCWDRTAEQLISELSTCGGDLGRVLGDYDPEVGAWICFNPVDGQGRRDANITEYRYALVESDEQDLDRQAAILHQMELPLAALVYSGKKSLHAIVRVDASDYAEYRKRVDYLYNVCKKNGLELDQQNRNPSRLSRMPGILRAGQKQCLLETNTGKSCWQEWQDWIESATDDLPDTENMADSWDDLPPLADPLIDGVLRQGHKMLLAGPSKAGKSFALIELCICIAEGKPWLGRFKCARGKVLYINLELDRASCLHRFRDVYDALGLPPDHVGSIDLWNLRGASVPMDKLAPKLIRRAAKKDYIAIVLDPIYKVITGDENSADQMANFCNQFDKVCTELGCAVIYCHHHSKGSQGGKRSMDRASGSGVFARDPDALLDLIELPVSEELRKQEVNKAVGHAVAATLQRAGKLEEASQDDLCTEKAALEAARSLLSGRQYEDAAKAAEAARRAAESLTAWRIEGTLREFPKFPPVNLWFDYPIHRGDDSGVLADIDPEGEVPGWQRAMQKRKPKEAKAKERKDSIALAFEACGIDGKVTVSALAEYMGVTDKTVRNRLKEHGGFWIDEGEVGRK